MRRYDIRAQTDGKIGAPFPLIPSKKSSRPNFSIYSFKEATVPIGKDTLSSGSGTDVLSQSCFVVTN